ncbi:MAG: chromosome segregation SMC family protein [Candidatus Kapaibacterium sp.]
MYLSKIEIAGFKSFALKTSLNLTEGLIAVVGPNGCGKTNIVDAVRWALGEQKTSVLRSDSMENVIFNGSKMRKPLGMAEVSLTIQNNKHILPLEYNEVTITRRLFRNGESQYLLNKTQCRLRDIVDLFMDTGMGANAYSVIELKMVEQILSDRANDRRTLFEEAAGITKYKSRRKEALRKLDAVQQDLSRVNDIVVEVQNVVASLGRQADKARLYNEVSQKLQIVDLGLLRYDYAQASSGIESIRKEFSEYSAQRDELHKQLEQAEQTLAELEGEQETANYELLQITEQESGYARTQAQLQLNLAVAQERQSSLIRSQERLSREQEESQRSHSTLVDALSRTSERFEIVKQSLLEAEESFTVKRSERDTHFTAVQQLRNDVRAADHEREQATRRYSDQKVRQERTAERIAGLQRRITELSHESRQTEQSLEQISQQLHSQEERLSGYEAAVKEAEQSRTQAQHTQQELRHRIEEKNTLLADKRNALTHKKATLDFLTGLVDTSESSRFLMSTGDWKPTADKAVLAELIGADDDVRIALEAA